MAVFDGGFAALPFDGLRSAALDRAGSLGCRHADLRVERIRTQAVMLRDARLEGAEDDLLLGMGVRVVADGAVGFAATVEIGPDAAARLVEQAVEAAATTARAGGEAVELADEPDHGTVEWTAPYEVDPTEVPLAEKVARLSAWSADLLGARGVDHVTASLLCVAEEKYLATLAGTVARQRRVRIQPSLEALAGDEASSSFETMRTLAPPTARGYEYLDGDGWDFNSELAALPELLAEKLRAPSVEPGVYDLVIDPTNLWLTLHESVGHATELDRALGYEAAYAGTSFATPDQLGRLRYGSALMNVSGDRTARVRARLDRLRRRGRRRPALRPGGRRDPRRLPARPAHRRWPAGTPARTAAPSPTRRSTSRCSGWRTSRSGPPPARGRRPRSSIGRRRPGHLHRRRQELVDRPCSATTSSSPGSASSGSSTAGSPGSCATSPTSRRRRSSGGRSPPSGGESTYLARWGLQLRQGPARARSRR